MEAGILAILGGQSTANFSGKVEEESEKGPLEPKFRKLMDSSISKKSLTDETQEQLRKVQKALSDGKPAAKLLTASDPNVIPEIVQELYGDMIFAMTPAMQTELDELLAKQGLLSDPMALWSITDSQSGSIAIGQGNQLLHVIVMNPDESGEQAALNLLLDVDTAEITLLGDQEGFDWEGFLEHVQMLQELEEVSGDEALPLVSFTHLPLSNWHAAHEERKIDAIRIIDVSAGSAKGVSQPVLDALADDNLAQLSDAELAELDALIDQITLRAGQKDISFGEFRSLMQEVVSPQAAASATDTVDIIQPSALSASHASNQTHQNDGLGVRLLHAHPTFVQQDATPTDQVKVTITQAFRAGLDRVVIQLEPADLGRVDVRLDLSSDGRTQIVIQADNRDTLDLLQRDARMLQQALQDAGIDANAQDMAFNLNEGNQGSDENGTKDALIGSYEENVEELRQPELSMDPLTGSYTLTIAQGLDIKV